MYQGYVKLWRKLQDNDLWKQEKFTRGQAWVDLLLLAKWRSGFFWVRDVKVDYKRGQVTEGILNLSLRWKWSRGKTQNFINILEKEQQIEQQKIGIITLITISKYELYQQNGQQNEQYTEQYTEQQNDNRQYTHKNIKKDKNIKNIGGRMLIEKEYFLDLLPIDLDTNKILAWADWVDYRKDAKKKLIKSTAKKQVDFLLSQPDFIECINQSIKNQWQGLFEVHKPQGSTTQNYSYREMMDLINRKDNSLQQKDFEIQPDKTWKLKQ